MKVVRKAQARAPSSATRADEGCASPVGVGFGAGVGSGVGAAAGSVGDGEGAGRGDAATGVAATTVAVAGLGWSAGGAAGDPHATAKTTMAHQSPEIRLAIPRDISMSYASA